ncbi:hypothetical protein HZH66_011744 [Vespula vulgaris]|uniref:Uncharacterized protein n=1 Tax=Vespula vulgaris TaxID=7454 RepID=A0A834JEY4_VESVU|nr:hypothetical protein HZH66_011744 [Vespula vulgaris]
MWVDGARSGSGFAGHTTTANTRNTMANYDDCDNNDKDEDKDEDEDACSLTTYARETKEFDVIIKAVLLIS